MSACKLATTKAKSSDVMTQKHVASKEGSLSQDKYEAGDRISTRLIMGYDRDTAHNCFHSGTFFQDTASNLVRVQPQVSLGAGETVVGNLSFEDWI